MPSFADHFFILTELVSARRSLDFALLFLAAIDARQRVISFLADRVGEGSHHRSLLEGIDLRFLFVEGNVCFLLLFLHY